MQLYNTLTRELEEFKPIKTDKVSFYHCGPTVYSTQHIGNLRGMTMGDSLRRSLEYLGYEVIQVRNYTDVGHLVSDADQGEDKMAKGASKEKLRPDQIANKYISEFEQDTRAINLLEPSFKPRATEFIEPMIEMISVLLDKGYAYQTDLAIYYDVSKFKNYNQLSRQELDLQNTGAGKARVGDEKKRQAQDFALWFFKTGEHKLALQTWDSPWGVGFPGWHLECSVMSKALLGETIDIHMGGVEHIPIHHTNEIAQSEAANGVKFVNYWLHNEHLLMNEDKMAKSKGTGIVLKQVLEKGFDGLDLRMFFLQAHYRSSQNFTWAALSASLEARQNLLAKLYVLKLNSKRRTGQVIGEYKQKFIEALSLDLNIAQGLALVWDLLDSKESSENVLATVLDFDKALGLKLKESLNIKIPEAVEKLATTRQELRLKKDFDKADQIRQEIEKAGFLVKDLDKEFIIMPLNF